MKDTIWRCCVVIQGHFVLFNVCSKILACFKFNVFIVTFGIVQQEVRKYLCIYMHLKYVKLEGMYLYILTVLFKINFKPKLLNLLIVYINFPFLLLFF